MRLSYFSLPFFRVNQMVAYFDGQISEDEWLNLDWVNNVDFPATFLCHNYDQPDHQKHYGSGLAEPLGWHHPKQVLT